MFREVNGRTVFDNGVVRIWRCPHCELWVEWEEDRCHVCGVSREADPKERGEAGSA